MNSALALLCLLPLAAPESPPVDRPGVLLELFADSSDTAPFARRILPSLGLDADEGRAHPARAPGPFRARLTTRLRIADGLGHRFALEVRGEARLYLGDQLVLEATSEDGPTLIRSEPRDLDEGHHALRLEFRSPPGGGPASVRLFREGEDFPIEPIRADVLSLPSGLDPDVIETLDTLDRGRRLLRERRCDACHAIPGLPEAPRPAPSLEFVGQELRPAALLRRITDPTADRPSARMPHLDLERGEAGAIVAALVAHSRPPREVDDSSAGNPRRGRELVLTTGCLACHGLDEKDLSPPPGGVMLDGAFRRRDRAALSSWLAPSVDGSGLASHDPGLPLSTIERRDVVAFLASLVSGRDLERLESGEAPHHELDDPLVKRGEKLVARHACGACHALPPGLTKVAAEVAPASPLDGSRKIDPSRSCVNPERRARAPGDSDRRPRPRYLLEEKQREAIRAYLENVQPDGELASSRQGEWLFEEKGCGSCHVRGEHDGLGSRIEMLLRAEPSLEGHDGLLRPPPLTAIGEKLVDAELERSIRGEQQPRRPWLHVRMPRFRHSPDEAGQLASFLRFRDGVPEALSPPTELEATPAELYEVGHRLVGAEGFSCSSCHALGDYRPESVEPGVRGPDLVGLGRAMRFDWFRCWMRDPARRAPGVEMPSITDPFPGLLHEDLDLQFRALWHALNSPDFTPPAATAVERVVVAPENPTDGGGPATRVIHDVFKLHGPYGDRWVPRALAVALPGRQNVLFDLDHFALIAWWTGPLARQRTQGKTWFWEIAGSPIRPRLPGLPVVTLEGPGGREVLPPVVGTTRGWLVGWTQEGEGLRLDYRLHLPGGGALPVTEWIEPRGSSGLVRRFQTHRSSLPEGFQVRARLHGQGHGGGLLQQAEPGQPGSGILDGMSWKALEPGFQLLDDSREGSGPRFRFSQEKDHLHTGWTQHVAFTAPAPDAIPLAGPPVRVEATELDLVPGYRVRRLPLDRKVMPTAFAFDEDGQVYLTTLNGQVRRLLDTDGDGLEDRSVVIAESFSAPYGILVEGDEILVSHKPELLRLGDRDGDGYLEQARVMATGWGFNDNYHDWVVGIVPHEGDYLVTLGSDYQQGGRPRETTAFRGKAMRITPSGELHEFASGLRFPMGIARHPDGELFFTDNQGNGNPFNELNHLREGQYYGLPSLYDDPDRKKRIGHAEPPAVNLPHPWTRSTNGLCFLGRDARYGAFATHGIGADYDTRKLVRLSLQKRGDTYQGAVYPFSRPRGGARGFLGPLAIARSPAGDIYLGNMKDSGWGGGDNIGTVCRLTPGELPAGLAEIRARRGGLELEFTRAVNEALASRAAAYSVSAYRRPYQGGYATPVVDRHEVKVVGVEVKDKGRRVLLELEPFREGFLYELHLTRLIEGDGEFWPDEGHFTLHEIPG